MCRLIASEKKEGTLNDFFAHDSQRVRGGPVQQLVKACLHLNHFMMNLSIVLAINQLFGLEKCWGKCPIQFTRAQSDVFKCFGSTDGPKPKCKSSHVSFNCKIMPATASLLDK